MYFNVGAENKISVSSKPVNDESGLGYEFYLNLISNNPVNGQVKFKVERVLYDPKLLPLPFALYTDKMKQEIARIVDEQNVRDRLTSMILILTRSLRLQKLCLTIRSRWEQTSRALLD